MKRTILLTILAAMLTTPALAKGTKGHKGSHKPKHHHGIVVKPIKTIAA